MLENNMLTKDQIAEEFKKLQDRICNGLEGLDQKAKFIEDEWVREEGGGGRTRIIRNGRVIEKGGVAFSKVFGPVSEVMKKQLGLDGDEFLATGVSIVLHPGNPHVPIIHMNVRYFELNTGVYWFGGGIDLTPHYIIADQAKAFHTGLKSICDKYNESFYKRFKAWADDYFFIPHRNETRGIGGVFFDHLDEKEGLSKKKIFEFCVDLGDHFVELYAYQANLGLNKPFTEQELQWRNLRRGRYVEFNLVHDRGTKFGLLSGGRTESILMSLPADASWEYNFSPLAGSPEAETIDRLKKGVDWVY
jgi:coproporphyrinogen III oxidase